MKKFIAAIIVVSLLLISCGAVSAAPASPAFRMNGKLVQEMPLNSKGEYYFQTGTVEKLFGVKFAFDTKKKKAKLTINKKIVQLDLLVSNKKNYVSISKAAALRNYLVRFDKASNTYFIIKQRNATEARQALQDAWQNKDLSLMQELVLSGAKLDLNRTLFLTSTNNGIELAKYLLSQGADIDYIDPVTGNQTLTNAIARGFEDFAATLIHLGANVHYGPQYMWPNLHFAVSQQLPLVTEELLIYGADPNSGYYARYGKNPETPLELASTKVNYTDENGVSGVKMPNHEIAAILLKYGASPKNDDSLENAIRAEDSELVEMLLKAGADPNKKNEAGDSLMKTIGIDPNSEIGKLVVKYGAIFPSL